MFVVVDIVASGCDNHYAGDSGVVLFVVKDINIFVPVVVLLLILMVVFVIVVVVFGCCCFNFVNCCFNGDCFCEYSCCCCNCY